MSIFSFLTCLSLCLLIGVIGNGWLGFSAVLATILIDQLVTAIKE